MFEIRLAEVTNFPETKTGYRWRSLIEPYHPLPYRAHLLWRWPSTQIL